MDNNNNHHNFDMINQLKQEMDTIGSRINKIGNQSPQGQRYPQQYPQKQPIRSSYNNPPYTAEPQYTQQPHQNPTFGHNTIQPRNLPYNTTHTPHLNNTISGPVHISASPQTVGKTQQQHPGVHYPSSSPINPQHHQVRKLSPLKIVHHPLQGNKVQYGGQQPDVVYHSPVDSISVENELLNSNRERSPNSLTKKGRQGEFQEVLFETIEDFEQKRKLYGDNSDLKSVGKLLLPLDVFLLYNDHNEISQEFNNKMISEKELVDADIDNFLKEIILMMEKVKEKLHHKIDFYHQGFFEYYSNFMKRTDEFLKHSISIISSSESMQNFQDMRKSFNENDPLSKEIGIFKKKKEQATQIEKLFRSIKDNYKGTKLSEMTKVIDSVLSEEVVAYKPKPGDIFFKNHQAEFGSLVMNDKKLSDDSIVNSFKIDLQKEAHRPPVPSQEVHRLRDYDTGSHGGEGENIFKKERPPASIPNLTQNNNNNPLQFQQNNVQMRQPQLNAPKVHFMDDSLAVKDDKINTRTSPQPEAVNLPSLPQATPSEAQISPNNGEIILKYNPKNPRIGKLKDFRLPMNASKITCIHALDSRNLAVGQKDGTLMMLDLEKNPQIENYITKQLNLKSQINCILSPTERQSTSLSPPPSVLYCALDDSSIVQLNFSGENATISRLKGHTGSVNNIIHYTPGKLFSCSDDGCVGLWDMNQQRALSLTRIHTSKINSICLMNSKKVLLSAGQDCKIGVFSVDEGSGKLMQVTELKDYYPIKNVSSFHNNTNFAVATSDDGMIKVWNIDRKECLNVIQGHSSDVLGLLIMTCLTKSPDIFFLSYAKGEQHMRYGDVDSHQNTEIATSDRLRCQFEKEGGSLLEIVTGNSKSGFKYCLVEQDEFGGARSVSLWSLE